MELSQTLKKNKNVQCIFQFNFSGSVLNILCEPTGGLPGSRTEEFQTVAVG